MNAGCIFGEKSLISAKQSANKRKDDLTAVIVAAQHVVNGPYGRCIGKDETVRTMRQHDLKRVAGTEIVKKIIFFTIHSVLSCAWVCHGKGVIIKTADTYRIAVDGRIHIVFLPDACTCFCSLFAKFWMLFLIGNLVIAISKINRDFTAQ